LILSINLPFYKVGKEYPSTSNRKFLPEWKNRGINGKNLQGMNLEGGKREQRKGKNGRAVFPSHADGHELTVTSL
jgi:hypothetical protein